MLLIPVHIGPSKIHGLGCFTDIDIKKGETVWVYDERIDLRIPKADVLAFPKPIQDYLNMYAYEEVYNGAHVMVLCGDHSKHMNHSGDPNLLEGEGGTNVAGRDIAAGEELTCDYTSFDLSVKF